MQCVGNALIFKVWMRGEWKSVEKMRVVRESKQVGEWSLLIGRRLGFFGKKVEMTNQCTFLSWNVRGKGTALKRTQVFSEICKAQAKIICIAEMDRYGKNLRKEWWDLMF